MIRSHNVKAVPLVVFAAVFVSLGSPVTAMSEESGDKLLEEVIVTAQKRDESLLDVPISMSVVSGQMLSEYNLDSMEDMESFVPNFAVKDTPANNEIYVRGIGSPSGALSLEQSVGIFIDGVYGGRARYFMAPFLDISHIEVLRGPQGAVVGKNTSSGAVVITTNQPTEELELSVTGDYEFEFDSYTITGIASGPLADRFKGRFAFRYEDIGGYVYNTVLKRDEPQKKNLALRAIGAWEASDKVDVTAKLEYADFSMDGYPFEQIPIGGTPIYERATDGLIGPDTDDTDSTNFTLTVNAALGENTLTSITAYGEINARYLVDGDFSALPFLHFPFEEDYQQFSQEVRLVSPLGGEFDYIVGASYLHHELDVFRQLNFAFLNTIHNSWYTQDSDTISIYGQGSWHFTPEWDATLSLRYTWEDKSADLRREQIGLPLFETSPISASRTENLVDPTLTVQYRPNEDSMFFARYARGSKGGGFAGASRTVTADTFEMEPETAISYELGTKLWALGHQMSFSAVAFYTKYEDLQVSVFNGAGFDFGNAAEAKSKGMEFDLSWLMTSELRFDGSLAFLNAKYTSFPGASCVAPRHVIPNCVEDIAGAPLHHAPDWSGTAALDYQVDFTDSLTFRGNLAVTFEDDSYTHLTLLPDSKQKAYAKINLRLAVGSQDGLWEVALVGMNLNDERTRSQAFETPFSAPPGAIPDHTSTTILLDRPRTIAIQGTIRY